MKIYPWICCEYEPYPYHVTTVGIKIYKYTFVVTWTSWQWRFILWPWKIYRSYVVQAGPVTLEFRYDK